VSGRGACTPIQTQAGPMEGGPSRRDDLHMSKIIQAAVTSVSWIPSEAVTGANKVMFSGAGPAHYDDPLPDRLGDLQNWKDEDRFRFANDLRVSVRVEDGPDGKPQIVGADYVGNSLIGSTTLRTGRKAMTFAAVALPELRSEPEFGDGWVKFSQTFGGRTGVPAPRRVNRPPFLQLRAPLVWTTLGLTVWADGRFEHEVIGASRFPRHWIYGNDLSLTEKVGHADFGDWYRKSFGKHTPWGDEESPAVVTAVETALERDVAGMIMNTGARPTIRNVDAGKTVVEQGDEGGELFLLLDGVLSIEVDGEAVADFGPGAILGERAVLEGGRRTSTMRAITKCRLAVVPDSDIDPIVLADVAANRRNELTPPDGARVGE